MTREEKKLELLKNPEMLLMKKPFTRGLNFFKSNFSASVNNIDINAVSRVSLPNCRAMTISQETYMQELDPKSHKIHYDKSVPSITMKLDSSQGGGYIDIEQVRMGLPYQNGIKNKQVLHLCGNPTDFTLIDLKPTQEQLNRFITFKQYWYDRNQDGKRTQFINAQKSYGDAGWLFYHDYKGRIKSRILSFPKYVLCPINDANGDRLLESIYFVDKNNIESIDCYDDNYIYHYKLIDKENNSEWKLILQENHGFDEIPLITHRGEVAWEKAQDIIEVYEILFNIFNVIQKRHGWGILYIKGNFDEKVKKIAGSIILADRSIDGNGSAEFKTPPNPQGYIDTLERLRDEIQTASSTTFILPKDIKTGGDISGIAMQLTQNGDNEKALLDSIEYQNSISKAVRLFKFGLSKELTQKDDLYAFSDFSKINIKAQLKVWMPKSLGEITQTLNTFVSQGITSKKTARERAEGLGINTPDEDQRCKIEEKEKIQRIQETKKETIEANESNTPNDIKKE